MKRITASDCVLALKLHKLSINAAALADIMGTDSRAVATALRKPTSDGRVSIHYKKGIGWYRFVRMSPKKGSAA